VGDEGGCTGIEQNKSIMRITKRWRRNNGREQRRL